MGFQRALQACQVPPFSFWKQLCPCKVLPRKEGWKMQTKNSEMFITHLSWDSMYT